jgi:uroporphyrinogen-III synthase
MTVREVPVTRTTLTARDEVRKEIAASTWAGDYQTIVLSSARATPYVDVALDYAVSSPVFGAVGRVTKKSLENLGYVVALAPEVSNARALGALVAKGPVLFVGARNPRPELEESVRAKGFEFFAATCYETTPLNLSPDEEAILKEADVIIIGAPSAWQAAKPFVSASTWVVVPGETTADEIRGEHERVRVAWGTELRPFLETQHS